MPTQREKTAYHEAGHAVASIKYGLEIDHVSIAPDGDSLGRVRNVHYDEIGELEWSNGPGFEWFVEREVQVFLAGSITEQVFFGYPETYFRSGDLDKANDLVSRSIGPADVQEKFWVYMEAKCRATVKTPVFRVQVEAVAAALLDRETLSGDEVKAMCREAIAQSVQRSLNQ